MIQVSTITAKNQVTIPSDIRDALNAEVGDKVMFKLMDDNTAVIQIVKKPSTRSLIGALRNESMPIVSINEARRMTQDNVVQDAIGKDADEA